MSWKRDDGDDVPLDTHVVSEIYREHGPALRRFVMRASGDRDTAEDILQETVIKVWQKAPQLTGSLRSYLFATARNILIDRHRRAAVRPQTTSLTDATQLPSSDAAPIEELLDRVVVEEALLRLSDEHRQVVLQLHYCGATVAQAAAHLGIPEGTVKSRAYYAVRALRSVLAEMGIER